MTVQDVIEKLMCACGGNINKECVIDVADSYNHVDSIRAQEDDRVHIVPTDVLSIYIA